MEQYVFDIILITLAVVVLLHLIFNNSLLVNSSCQNNSNEGMASIKDDSSVNTRRERKRQNRTYDDGEHRDTGTTGVDRTSEEKQWYHVANKLVTENTVNGELVKTLDTIRKAQRKPHDDSPKTSKKDGESADNDGKRVRQQVLSNLKRSRQQGRIVFPDNYEGRMTSDPFIADPLKTPSTLGPRPRYSDEKFTDVLGNECSVNEDSLEMKRYIREYVLDGKSQCGCITDKSKSDFTRDEIDAYREQQLEFRDKINGTSAPAEDPVDRMNLITMQGGVKAQGQTIAEFYDKLLVPKSASPLKQPYPSAKCMTPPSFDNESGVPHAYYSGEANNGGRYMMRDNWMYAGENPNNGGMLYDGIFGNDQMIEDDRMI
ncbi:hypothetical protein YASMINEVIRUS_497 [Yasminevirus sp. GU-2018]|uniref:Uncharacterized protein n=1 Tax=Yasminevirus sp. GU-2018 TaxID=2420051 RepID=A0A5K0U979_9VIRU|nr:hypothetical protein YASMINEVIRUS_497 [Yasminevirus sp. GU-2018]